MYGRERFLNYERWLPTREVRLIDVWSSYIHTYMHRYCVRYLGPTACGHTVRAHRTETERISIKYYNYRPHYDPMNRIILNAVVRFSLYL